MIDRLEVSQGPGTVIRFGNLTAWASASASASLLSFLSESARNLAPSPISGDQLADHLAGVLERRDPEPHVPFVVIGPSEDGWVALLHGPVQLWDGASWTTPSPEPGWLRASVSPRPSLSVSVSGTPAPAMSPDSILDLEAGVVPGGGFVLIPSVPSFAGVPIGEPTAFPLALEGEETEVLDLPGGGPPTTVLPVAAPAEPAGGAGVEALEPPTEEAGGPETGDATAPTGWDEPEAEPDSDQLEAEPDSDQLEAEPDSDQLEAAPDSDEPEAQPATEPSPPEPEPEPESELETAADLPASVEAEAVEAESQQAESQQAESQQAESLEAESQQAESLQAEAVEAPAAAQAPSGPPAPPGVIDLRSPAVRAKVVPYPPLPPAGDPPRPVPGAPVVAGVPCPQGHLNRPGMPACARCGRPIGDGRAYQMSGTRPALGCLISDRGAVYRLDSGYLVGSDPAKDPTVRGRLARPLVLPGDDVAPSHAELRLHDWDVVVTDRASEGGTHVFEPGAASWERLRPYDPRVLLPGTHLAFGQRVVTFVTPWTLQAPGASPGQETSERY